MKIFFVACLALLSATVRSQDVLPAAPTQRQQPIGMEGGKMKTGTALGIAASCVIDGMFLFTPKPASNVYVGAGIIAAGTGLSLYFGGKHRGRDDVNTGTSMSGREFLPFP